MDKQLFYSIFYFRQSTIYKSFCFSQHFAKFIKSITFIIQKIFYCFICILQLIFLAIRSLTKFLEQLKSSIIDQSHFYKHFPLNIKFICANSSFKLFALVLIFNLGLAAEPLINKQIRIKCAQDQFFDKNDNVCKFNCLLDKNSRGINIKANECLCNQRYIWDMSQKNCKLDCSVDKFSTKSNLNIDECICMKKYFFNKKSKYCKINCPMIKYTININSQKNVCSCQQNYKWNKHHNECKFYIKTDYIIITIFIGSILISLPFIICICVMKKKQQIVKHEQITDKNIQMLDKVGNIKESHESCSICLQNTGNMSILTNCNHYFHSECIFSWYDTKQVCPNCRKQPLKLYIKCRLCLQFNILLRQDVIMYYKNQNSVFDSQKQKYLTSCKECKKDNQFSIQQITQN